MKNRHQLTRSVICLGIVSIISACGGGGDSSEPEELTCRAPLVLNSDKTACITEVVNTAPTINSASTITLDEGTAIGTNVYTASASDAEGDSISWSLADSEGIFSIDANSGQITVQNVTKLIAANLSSYQITITATDGASSPLSSSLTIDVNVNTVLLNQAPVITSSASFSVLEATGNGTAVYTAIGNDPDGDLITWSLDDPQSIFAIDQTTGVITITDSSKLVFANLATYKITLVAQDDALVTEQSELEITVTVVKNSNAVEPSVVPTDSQAAFYYKREDGNYTGWKIHAWNNEACDGYFDFDSTSGTEWDAGLSHDGIDENYGAYWLVETKVGATCLNYILHNGNDKDPDDVDHKLTLSDSRWAFIVSGGGIFHDPNDVTTETPFRIEDASAHWIDENTVLWNGEGNDLRIVYDEEGKLDNSFSSTNSTSLTLTTLTDAQKLRVPHLVAGWKAYSFNATLVEQKSMLKKQLVLASFSGDEPISATYVQTAKALDAIYTFGADDADEVTDFGVTYNGDVINVKVWAPTAKTLKLKVYSASKSLVATHDMDYDDLTGVWSFATTADESYDRLFYRFSVEVYHPVAQAVVTTEATDPYSVNTSTNGRYSQFVNLNDEDLKPTNWENHSIPTVKNIEDATILETHIRDFSIFDTTTTSSNRGKYMAFTESGTDANNYLSTLASSGLTHFHMLPANDIASIEEDESKRIELTSTVGELCARNNSAPVCGTESNSALIIDVLDSYDPATNEAKDLVNSLRGMDGFNWGYDPHHFNVVEGSYSSDPDGAVRVKEFREMVQALHEKGLRVVLDVVYNHTSSSGLYDNSVFDKLVPGYYHRYSEVTGDIERSTCCENTATEHRMMGKFVIDSLVHWAQNYGLDGFRFDIMGHMPLDVLLDGRTAVAAIDPDTYFYGEGWDWGEVAGNRLFKQATQANMANTEIGSFNDRPRDTIRSAALSKSSSSLSDIDHIRLGMAGTLQNFELVDQNGTKKLGKNFAQSSFALDPADIINYVSKHDNESLWDNLQYEGNLAPEVDSETRVRIHSLSAAIPLVSQGIPFFQLAIDKLRSKSMDRNTYDAGDWFNRVDYTNISNNWNVGLPIELGGEFKAAISANANIPVTSQQIERSSAVFNEFLQIRKSSPLFRLTDESQVIRRVGFHNTGPNQTKGLIMMSIDDGTGLTDLDENNDALLVAVNGTANTVNHAISSASGFTLHPVQLSSADSVVQTASFSEDGGVGTFSVPAHTIAVFVKAQGNAQSTGLAVDPDYVNSPYGDTPIFVSGVASEKLAFEYDGRGVYAASATLEVGSTVFDITDMNSTEVDLSFSDVVVADDSIVINDGGNDDFSTDVSQAGTYAITIDVLGDTPTLSIRLQNALVSCETPVSAGEAPFAITGGKLYVRGEHSEWLPKPEFELVYIGSNQYQAVANFNGSFPFKLASNDGSWTTQLWAQNSSGEIETGDLVVGVSYDVAYKGAGTTNNQTTLSDGKYSFLLTLNEENPAQGNNVGTLLIEQCSN